MAVSMKLSQRLFSGTLWKQGEFREMGNFLSDENGLFRSLDTVRVREFQSLTLLIARTTLKTGHFSEENLLKCHRQGGFAAFMVT
jgi:hypothetical protein